MRAYYSLKDIFGYIRFESYNKSDLLKRLNNTLQEGGLKPLKQKELKECGFYIVKNR